MRVAVIGAGVVGITTAHFVSEKGCEVTVFEANGSAGSSASFANGGQLSYSFVDSLANPQLLRKLPTIIGRRDVGARFYPKFRASFVGWAFRFLVNCGRRRADVNSLALWKLAIQSAELMPSFHRRLGSQYQYRRPGKLVLLDGPPKVLERERIAKKRTLGLDTAIISADEAMQIEPSLSNWVGRPHGAIYSKNDEVGDARSFTVVMTNELRKKGVEFRFGSCVEALATTDRRKLLVKVRGRDQLFDAVILCSGGGCENLLGRFGIRFPVYPVAGYSVTLPVSAGSPRASITVPDKRIVMTRLGDNIRLAGFADVNLHRSQQVQRINELLMTARRVAPEAADYEADDIYPWTGYRPMTPSSLPITGPTRIPGLFVNLGHGMFGWTLCAATAFRVAQCVVNGGDTRSRAISIGHRYRPQ